MMRKRFIPLPLAYWPTKIPISLQSINSFSSTLDNILSLQAFFGSLQALEPVLHPAGPEVQPRVPGSHPEAAELPLLLPQRGQHHPHAALQHGLATLITPRGRPQVG